MECCSRCMCTVWVATGSGPEKHTASHTDTWHGTALAWLHSWLNASSSCPSSTSLPKGIALVTLPLMRLPALQAEQGSRGKSVSQSVGRSVSRSGRQANRQAGDDTPACLKRRKHSHAVPQCHLAPHTRQWPACLPACLLPACLPHGMDAHNPIHATRPPLHPPTSPPTSCGCWRRCWRGT
jgi:hypothetical protein